MKKSKYKKAWDHGDSPLIWVETLYAADMEWMPKNFKFIYDRHYFVSDHQFTSMYLNVDSIKRANEFGFKLYKNNKFIHQFIYKSTRVCKNLQNAIKEINKTNLKKLDNENLFKLFIKFFNNYANYFSIYRISRPEFYERIIAEIKKKLPRPKDNNLELLLEDKFDRTKIDKKIIKLATNLKEVGERRLKMHKIWMNSYLKANKLFIAIGKRTGLTSLEVQNSTRNDIRGYLTKGITPNKKEIQERIRNFKFIYRENTFDVIIPKSKTKKIKKVKKIKGVSAYSGIVQGKVIILKESLLGTQKQKIKKISRGYILVTEMTSPDMVLAMKKSIAIVTDDGGMLCHAAIVSRELKKPCVVGTKIATKVLRDNDLIEVNANEGIVKIL